jgi:hypothetical protein
VSLRSLWLFLAVALPVLASLIAGLSSVDLTYHLRAGSEMLASGALPTVDTWTFTVAGLSWVDQQWGAQLVLEGTYRLGGWTGLAILRAALIGVIFGILLLIGLRRGLDERTAALLTLAAFFVSSVALTLRPQLLGMTCFAIVLLIVTDRRRHPGRLWLVPLLTLVWANLHGSFFLAPLVLGLAWLEDLHDRVDRPYRPLLVALVSALAACVTPFGPAVWAYAVGLSMNPLVTSRISEWQPTSLRDGSGILFYASALAVAALLARRDRPTPWPTLAWLAVFFLIGAYAVRGMAWWPLAAATAVSGVLATTAGGARASRAEPPTIRRLNLVVAGLLVIACIALLPLWRPIDPGLGTPVGVVGNAPPGITAAVRDLAVPGDRLFAPQPWGSWFEWTLPTLPVALDSRIELFPPDVWERYEQVEAGVDGWQEQLDAWGVTIAIAAGDGADAFTERLMGAGWRQVHEDEDGRVLVRADRARSEVAPPAGTFGDVTRPVALLESRS